MKRKTNPSILSTSEICVKTKTLKFAFTIVLLLIISMEGFSGEFNLQQTRLPHSLKDATVGEVLKEIEKVSDYYFFYNRDLVDVDRRVDFPDLEENVFVTLDKLFQGTNIKYTVVERQIVLTNNSAFESQPSANSYSISGKVTDRKGEPLPFANVVIENTTIGTVTNNEGLFTLKGITKTNCTLIVSYFGYIRQSRELNFTANVEGLEFVLEEDLLSLEEVVVTGTSNPKSNLESSVAITSINAKAIKLLAPSSTADLLQSVPGFLVENSGGEVGNNLFARGIPSAGAYEFVCIQEDGLPVFEDGALQFSNVDNYLRVDETVLRVEALRGGSGAIYASNAPGGIINFISKTGAGKFEGISKLTVGTSGLFRADANFGGPISDNFSYNLGGFYRYDNGVRNPGFPANNGGQIKANVTYKKGRSHIRVYYKRLDDRNLFLLPIPLKNPSNPEGISGFDPNYGTYASNHLSKLKVPQLDGGNFERSLRNGVHSVVDAFGGQAKIDMGSGWSVENSARYTKIDLGYNAIFTVGSPTSPANFANNIDSYLFDQGVPPISNPVYSYVDDGTTTNPNLVVPVGFWAIDKNMTNFANKLEINFSNDNHFFTLGYYHSSYSATQYWNWTRLLIEASDNARLLNLVNGDLSPGDTNYSRTIDGMLATSWLTRESQLKGQVNSVYLNEEFKVNNRLSLDGGVRLEIAAYKGYRANSDFFSASLGDHTTTADDMITVTGAPITSWKYGDNQDKDPNDDLIVRPAFSIGGNFKINSKNATYLRVSNSFRSPIEEAYYDNVNNFEAIKPVIVTQGELGYKFNSPVAAVFANLFVMDMQNLAFTDILTDGSSENLFAGALNYGLELEANAKYNIIGVNFTSTFQNPTLNDFSGNQEKLNGKLVRRIPRVFAKLRPYIEPVKGLNLYVQFDYFGKKYSDNDNLFELPDFFVLGAGASYERQKYIISINGFNLTNTIGLTEGDPRVGGAPNEIFNARPILGAYAKLSFAYRF